MMPKPLDELYFPWLYSQVAPTKVRSRTKSYWKMFRQLYNTEIVWIIPNDDNRLEDGKELRKEWFDLERNIPIDEHWLHLGCSVLEMLIGLSRRLCFETEINSELWFWKLMENLELYMYNDSVPNAEKDIEIIIEQLIWRTYSPDGRGGLFPLSNPDDDQRRVEIWYQMFAYLEEENI